MRKKPGTVQVAVAELCGDVGERAAEPHVDTAQLRASVAGLRDVEELMVARGVVVTYETIRSWCAKFGPDYAAQLGRRRPRPGDNWHFDEVFVTINATTH